MPRRATAQKEPAKPKKPPRLEDLTAVERRFVQGQSRSPADAREAAARLAQRCDDTPEGYISFCGVPDEDDGP